MALKKSLCFAFHLDSIKPHISASLLTVIQHTGGFLCIPGTALQTSCIMLSLHTSWWHIGGGELFLPSFLTSAQDASEWLASCVSRFNPREGAPISVEQNAVWAPEPVGKCRRKQNVLPLPELKPGTVQHVA